jgi:hypothetical protein
MSLGAILNYITPPRDVVVRKIPEGSCLEWKADKFARFYEDEHADILAELRKVQRE